MIVNPKRIILEIYNKFLIENKDKVEKIKESNQNENFYFSNFNPP